MRVTVNNQTIDPANIALDSFGWDNEEARGPLSLVIHLEPDALLTIGQRIWAFAQECLADEPDLFEGEYGQDIPQPSSEQVFVEQPTLLATYLEDMFWSRETIIAIIGVVTNDVGYRPGDYLIVDFRTLDVTTELVRLEFGVWGGSQSPHVPGLRRGH